MTKNFEIVYRNPAELIPYEMNAKKHDEQQIRDLAAAIKKRGFDQPITVDKHDVIITGHGRREAALLAGLERSRRSERRRSEGEASGRQPPGQY